jgi:hypothetical protein
LARSTHLADDEAIGSLESVELADPGHHRGLDDLHLHLRRSVALRLHLLQRLLQAPQSPREGLSLALHHAQLRHSTHSETVTIVPRNSNNKVGVVT